jgi:DNA-directed RNA polymerase subunit RPC12/RpoP
MAILIQCSNCQRTLRVQDHLLGKSVKCPNCQIKFLAQGVDGTAPPQAAAPATSVQAAEPALADNAPARSLGEDTPVTPPLSPPAALPDPAIPVLEVTEPASAPSAAPAAKPQSGERIAATPLAPAALPMPPEGAEAPPQPAPAQPQPFETPALHVLAVMAVIVLLATMLGCGLGWWVGAAVEKAAAVTGPP